jgi:uncharacterized membrane-anchored protein
MTAQTPGHRLILEPARLRGNDPWTRILLNKVPEVTLLFWVVNVLSTTVGETTSHYLSGSLGLRLSATTAVMSVVFVAALICQFSIRRHVPAVYWLTVVLASAVGTLCSDDLVDNLGISLWASTAVFALCLAVVLAVWYRSERTLSIHTVVTRRREAFYWASTLCTFALGTSLGALISDGLPLGYGAVALIFGGIIVLIGVAFYGFKISAVLAFWAAYVMTRPFGDSVGDLLTAAPKHGGLGLGTGTSHLFLAVIVAVVAWLSFRSGADRAPGLPGVTRSAQGARHPGY